MFTQCCSQGHPDGRLCPECEVKALLRVAIKKCDTPNYRRKGLAVEDDTDAWQENAIRALEGD